MRGSGRALPLAAAAVWLATVAAFEWVRPAGSTATLCLVRNVTGLPCPTCGSTRAVRAMIAGRPLEAMRCNPLVVTLGLGCAAWLLLRAAGVAPRMPAGPVIDAALAVAAVLLVAVNWWYVLVHDGAGAAPWR